MENPDTVPATTEGSPKASRRAGLAIKIVGALAVIVVLSLAGRQLAGSLQDFSEWVQGLGFWGPLVFIVGYAVATVAFAPGSLLTLAAGFIFGLGPGTLYVFFGSTLGASAAFLIARYVARGAIERRLAERPRFQRIDRAIGAQGLKIVFLLRLSPVFPFNLLNYALGLTRVRFVHYLIACLGMIPGTFLYVYYGTAAGTIAEIFSGGAADGGRGKLIVLGVGLVATVVVTTVITRIARRALEQEVEDD